MLDEVIQEQEKIDVDIVVLALPLSNRELAQTFLNKGIKHVVCFDFSNFPFKLIDPYDNEEFDVSDIMEMIYTFTIKLYSDLVNEKSIKDAFFSSKNAMNQEMHKRARYHGIDKKLYDSSKLKTCILLPADSPQHKDKIFDNKSFDERLQIHEGEYFDSSSCRGFINFTKPEGFLTGRLKEIFKAIYEMGGPNSQKVLTNVFGPKGIGKTRVLKEIGYGLNSRLHF